MNLLEFTRPALILSPEDPVSKAISELHRNNRRELVLQKDGQYKGIVFARDLARQRINNPQRTEIGNFLRNIKPFPPETDLDEIINDILVNDHKSVPVKGPKKGEIQILTKLDILNHLKGGHPFPKTSANDIMRKPYCLTPEDDLSTAVSVIRDAGISRLPVVGKNNRLEGLITDMDLLVADREKERRKKGDRAGEKTPSRAIKVKSLLRKNVPTVTPEDSIKKVIDLMKEKDTPTALVKRKTDQTLEGIITPKMILKLVGEKRAGVHVRVSGLQDEDPFVKSFIDKELRNTVQKLGKFYPLDYMVLHIDKYRKEGKKTKYSVKARLMTEKGMFFAQEHAWDLTKAVGQAMEELERQVKKRKEKLKEDRRLRRLELKFTLQ